MLIRSRAPLRLGLAGGGTDVAPFCDMHGGCVLNATIDLYAQATLEPLISQAATVEFIAPDLGLRQSMDAVYPLPTDRAMGLHCAVYNRIMRDYNAAKPMSLRLTTFADAPSGSGLGTSSTLVVAMLKAFQELLGLPLGEYEVAQIAYEIERIEMRFSGGKQDQYAATFGGFNFIEFYADDRVIVNPLRIKNWIACEFESSILLYFTGVSRESARIIDQQKANMESNSSEVLAALYALKQDAVSMKESLLRGDIERIIGIFKSSWESKKKTAQSVTNSEIDRVIDLALGSGARAAKISGAGGGGFIMFIVDPARRIEVRRALEQQGGSVTGCHFSHDGTQGWRVP